MEYLSIYSKVAFKAKMLQMVIFTITLLFWLANQHFSANHTS